MKYLIDTHLLLWIAITNDPLKSAGELSSEAKAIIGDMNNELFFSPVNIWEVAIKNALGKPDFAVDPHVFRRQLLDNGYQELPVSSAHAAGIADLEDRHADPFDRMLIAQATIEGIVLLTHDGKMGNYTKNPIKMV